MPSIPNLDDGHDVLQPIAVTGMGLICPAGINVPECWDNIINGNSAISDISKRLRSETPVRIGGQFPESYYEYEKDNTPRKLLNRTSDSARLVRLCAYQALENSGLEINWLNRERCGIVIGTSFAGEFAGANYLHPANERFNVLRKMRSALSAWPAIEFGFKGPHFTVSATDASGAYAITHACELIRSGQLDCALAGGVDTLATEYFIDQCSTAGLLSRRNDEPARAMRPFDRDRDGFVISEGCCVLFLESWRHARARQADPYAWIRGYSCATSAIGSNSEFEMAEQMAWRMESAIEAADISRGKIGYINAYGISTKISDRQETHAIRSVFGERACDLVVSSPKSVFGHTMGASGAIDVALSALTLFNAIAPPTINYESPDPDCNSNYVHNDALRLDQVKAAMSNSFGLGGQDCVIVLTREDSTDEY
jgi:3-oxoacyl-[acyl-carrier-protein] synthase II